MSRQTASRSGGRHSKSRRPAAWPFDERERGDFLHPPRAFPPEVRLWRERIVDQVIASPGSFPNAGTDGAREQVRSLLDQGIAELREINRILELLHGTPSLGNLKDPVDELVFIILSRKTREDAYIATFEALKKRFPRWEELLEASPLEVERIVDAGGLGKKKTRSLIGALKAIVARFGNCSMAPARRWSDDQLEEFLCSLPEVSRKSAYCVMMYSLGRDVFPVDTHVGRILQRVGIFKHLGLDLTGLDHKQLQASLADVIPPILRYSLHVNLVVHGRAVCHAVKPACESCEIRRFCMAYRDVQRERLEAKGAPTVIDIFSGAGGLSEGFARAGFQLVAAVDKDPVALQTHWLNHPALRLDGVLVRDVAQLKAKELQRLLGRRQLDVLIGAPPCQGFSSVGFRSKMAKTGYRLAKDERNHLFEYLIELALVLRPRLFLMENVPGMRSALRDELSYLDAAREMLEKRGKYSARIWQLNATPFGVPQDRSRCFLVAARKDPIPVLPRPEYQDVRRHGSSEYTLPPITLDEALVGVPEVASGSGTSVELWDPAQRAADDRRLRRYLSKFRLLGDSPVIYNHYARYNNERDLELYSLLRPGEDGVHAVERHGRPDLMTYRQDAFDDKYARLRGDRPCKTIVSHLAKDGNGYIHPREVRSITVREAARVQSFQDDYVFCGSPSDQWIQVGNAVPPLLSEAIAKIFLRTLKG